MILSCAIFFEEHKTVKKHRLTTVFVHRLRRDRLTINFPARFPDERKESSFEAPIASDGLGKQTNKQTARWKEGGEGGKLMGLKAEKELIAGRKSACLAASQRVSKRARHPRINGFSWLEKQMA